MQVMNWLARLMMQIRRPEPLLPPELAWRIEIICSRGGLMDVLTSNYEGVTPDAELYAACAQLCVEAASRHGVGPDVLLSALAHRYLKPTIGHLSGKKLIVAR
jgi:hypothetical protein